VRISSRRAARSVTATRSKQSRFVCFILFLSLFACNGARSAFCCSLDHGLRASRGAGLLGGGQPQAGSSRGRQGASGDLVCRPNRSPRRSALASRPLRVGYESDTAGLMCSWACDAEAASPSHPSLTPLDPTCVNHSPPPTAARPNTPLPVLDRRSRSSTSRSTAGTRRCPARSRTSRRRRSTSRSASAPA
jgi:hypothetical protein